MILDLSDEEVKTIIDILKYSQDYCPIESVSDRVDITIDRVQELIVKLEQISESQ